MDNNPKIYNHSIECLLVGYSNNSKAYWCWDKRTDHIHVTHNVVFAELQDLQIQALHPGLVLNDDDPDDVEDAPYHASNDDNHLPPVLDTPAENPCEDASPDKPPNTATPVPNAQ